MGKQVNFYMTADDELAFLELVRSTGNVVVLNAVDGSSELKDIIKLPPEGQPFWFSLCLWNRDCSPPPTLKYIPEQSYYCIEEAESEVIQLYRSGTDNGRITRGRIWAEMAYWQLFKDPPRVIHKSDDFKKWYDRQASWIRRNAAKDSLGHYVFPGAARK